MEQLHLDERYAVLREVKAGKISDAAARKRLEGPLLGVDGDGPQSKRLWVVDMGNRRVKWGEQFARKRIAHRGRDRSVYKQGGMNEELQTLG